MSWATTAKAAFHFSTQKKVLIRDWRLGLALRALQLLVVAYCLLRFLWRLEYLAPSIPTNFMDIESFSNDAAIGAQRQMITMSPEARNASRCGPNGLRSYDFYHSEERGNFTITGCEALPSHVVAREGSEKNSFGITTARQKISETRLPAPRLDMDASSCEEHFLANGDPCKVDDGRGTKATYSYTRVPATFALIDVNDFGACICTLSGVFLETGIEEEVVTIAHEVRSSALHSSKEVISFALPKTYVRVRDIDGDNVKIYQRGDRISFKVSELMDWLKIDLDKPMSEGEQVQWLPEKGELRDQVKGIYSDSFPKPRLAGMTVHMEFNYFNYDRGHKTNSVDRGEAVCILVLRPFLKWTVISDKYVPMGDMFPFFSERSLQEIKFGIKLESDVTGEMSQPSLARIITILVDTVVMIQAVNIIVQYFARFGLGDRSILYNELIMEKISIVSAYARFAIQAVVAAAFFDWMDANGDETIEYQELVVKINHAFSQEKSPSQLMQNLCLADITMTSAYDHETSLEEVNEYTQKDYSREKDRRKSTQQKRLITRNDFVDMFTGSPCSLRGAAALTRTRIKNGWEAGRGLDDDVKEVLRSNFSMENMSFKSFKNQDFKTPMGAMEKPGWTPARHFKHMKDYHTTAAVTSFWRAISPGGSETSTGQSELQKKESVRIAAIATLRKALVAKKARKDQAAEEVEEGNAPLTVQVEDPVGSSPPQARKTSAPYDTPPENPTDDLAEIQMVVEKQDEQGQPRLSENAAA